MTVKRGGLLALLVFIILLYFYSRTLLPGVVGGDAGELQYAAPLLALVHPQGQPLYLAIGFLWSHLFQIGSYAWRMNVLAAICGAATCAAVTVFVYYLYRRGTIAIITGLTLGLGATLWGQSILADKYAFSALWIAVVSGLVLAWSANRDLPSHYRWLYAAAFAFGLGTLHHRSIYLLAPAVALLVLFHYGKRLRQEKRHLAISAALVLLPPLLTYPLFLPWVRARNLSPLLWRPTSVLDWVQWWLEWHVISGEALVFDNSQNVGSQLNIYVETLYKDYSWGVIVIALIGVVWLLRRMPYQAFFLGISFVLVGGLAANFRGNERQFTYYLPSFVLLLYAYAAGLVAIWNGVTSGLRAPFKTAAQVFLTLLFFMVPVLQFQYAYPLQYAVSRNGNGLDIWRQTLKSGTMAQRLTDSFSRLPQNAVLVADWEQVTPLWYTQRVDGVRPDITLQYPIPDIQTYDPAGRPLCTSRHIPDLDVTWHPTNVGALLCLNPSPQTTVPPVATTTAVSFLTDTQTPQLSLIGYTLGDAPYQQGNAIPLSLVWRAMENELPDYSISLRLINAANEVVWSEDINAPVLGMYPTSRWIKDEVVEDYHEIAVPSALPAGAYNWALVLYRQLPDGTFVQLQDSNGLTVVPIGTLQVASDS